MENFTPIASTIGGLLIGLSAAMLFIISGRIAGISGIFNGMLIPQNGEFKWRATFMAGLLSGGAIMWLISPTAFEVSLQRPLVIIALAGLLVGFGTQMGSGCTSGHGVCGLARFSRRSLVATLTFMASGALTVFVVQHLLGGF